MTIKINVHNVAKAAPTVPIEIQKNQ